MAKIVSIGEGMLELTRMAPGGEEWRMRYGGDTLNVAVYLARLGQDVAYLTALGNDGFSDAMREEWSAEGIDTSMVLARPDRLPGLYLIETDPDGERSFHYWRDRSAVRALFECDGIASALEQAERAELLYLSGITLSLFDDEGRRRLLTLCEKVRQSGGQVAFDPNYRPRGWQSAEAARSAIAEFAPLVSIALPTLEDEKLLYGDAEPEQSLERWTRHGFREWVIKLGASGVLTAKDGQLVSVPAETDPAPHDTTGAGDAFNAAYLAARWRGLDVAEAAARGNLLGEAVVRHPGAIIPRAAMPFGAENLSTKVVS